jgi:hypothetical protein
MADSMNAAEREGSHGGQWSASNAVLRAIMEEEGYCWTCEEDEIDGKPHDECTGLEGYVCECHCREEPGDGE